MKLSKALIDKLNKSGDLKKVTDYSFSKMFYQSHRQAFLHRFKLIE
jgi:hypothetical protein